MLEMDDEVLRDPTRELGFFESVFAFVFGAMGWGASGAALQSVGRGTWDGVLQRGSKEGTRKRAEAMGRGVGVERSQSRGGEGMRGAGTR